MSQVLKPKAQTGPQYLADFKRMQSTSNYSVKGSEKASKAIENIMRIAGTFAVIWILLFILAAIVNK